MKPTGAPGETTTARAGCAGIVPLPARLEPWQAALCEQPDVLAAWIDLHGSPLNVIDPTPLARNAEELQREAAGGVAGAGEIDARRAIEQSLRVGTGLALPSVDWALGHTWRTLYPAVVARLGGDGLSARDWPAFLRLARELERVAFGPPALNAAKLLALVEAGRIDLGHLRGATPAADSVIDAVLPGPGLEGGDGLLGELVRGGHARVAAGRRGLEVTPDGSCRGRDGSITPGLAAIGRPTEDSVIGNDTLSRSLHPQADRWARRVTRRSREGFLAAALGAQREATPA